MKRVVIVGAAAIILCLAVVSAGAAGGAASAGGSASTGDAPPSDPDPELPPRVILDWAKCGLKVVSTEIVDKVTGTGGVEIKSERRDFELLVIELRGIAPKDGFTSVYPNSFGLQFLYRGVNTLVQSKAWAMKGKNPDTGEPVESWNSDPAARTNLGFRANQEVKIWFVCDVPKEVKEFLVLVPSLLDEPVKLGK